MTEAPEPAAPPALPAPPRPVTPRVAWRAWADPPVRFWWLAAAALVGAALYLGASQFLAWRRVAWLVREGTPISATVLQAGQEVWKGRNAPPTAVVRLEFPWQGSKREVEGQLEGRRTGDYIYVGSAVPIRVDPGDPTQWTARTDPPPLAVQLLPAVVPLPLAVAAFGGAWAMRRRVLRTWRDGTSAEATVFGRQQTALAPQWHAVRCTGAGPDGRVATVYVPRSHDIGAGGPDGGRDVVRVILPPDGRGRPLAAAWFE